MRRLLTLSLIAAAAQVSHAHTLAGDESLLLSLDHQLLGLHHLPFSLLLIVGGLLLLRQYFKNRQW